MARYQIVVVLSGIFETARNSEMNKKLCITQIVFFFSVVATSVLDFPLIEHKSKTILLYANMFLLMSGNNAVRQSHMYITTIAIK